MSGRDRDEQGGDKILGCGPDDAERLREAAEDEAVVRDLDEAAAEIDRGEGRSLEEAEADLRRRLKLPKKPRTKRDDPRGP